MDLLDVAAPIDPLADLKLTPAPGKWAADAACVATGDGASFTPATKPDPDELAVIVGVCRHCSVRTECSAYAARWAMYGVWAGQWIDRTRPQRNVAATA